MKNKHQDDLSHIRSMMERSSRFISLSGLSGICAGITAILGASCAKYLITLHQQDALYKDIAPSNLITKLVLVAIGVLMISLFLGTYFTVRKSKKLGLQIWTTTTKQLLFQLVVPLVAGGVFCAALLYYHIYGFVAPATLIFYGLALINTGKYTYSDVTYLGLCEIVLGLAALFFPGHGLLFWIVGFGLLHILYGVLMYKKYK